MKIINKRADFIFNLIGFQTYEKNKNYKLTTMCYVESVDDSDLIYNALTCEMILTNKGELYHKQNEEFLVKHWFFIEENFDMYSFCNGIKQMYCATKLKTHYSTINFFTIMTTMSCNARCPYCFEKGRKITTMNKELALDVGKYIGRYGTENLKLFWFGGEPLCNTDAVDVICKYLNDNNIKFDSRFATNGYLINTIKKEKFLKEWNTIECQITLDGTEDMYNETKGFVNVSESAFKRVINNIDFLLENNVRVIIRLNVSNKNYDNLYELIDLLYEKYNRYIGSRIFSVYCHLLFDEEMETDKYIKIDKRLRDLKLLPYRSLTSKKIVTNCMANSFNNILITAEGKLGLCEHFSDTEFIGSIYGSKLDYSVINEWHMPEWIKECKTCPYYFQCTKIKKCPDGRCTQQWRDNLDFQIRDSMKNTYKKFRSANNEKSNDL